MLVHIPTGITVRSETQRTQHANEQIAWELLTKKLKDIRDKGLQQSLNDLRSKQVGSGERGDKRRTYQVKHGIVTDHITNKKTNFKNISRGEIALLHNPEFTQK